MADVNSVTRIEITAADKTGQAFASVKRGASELQAAFAGVQSSIAALGIGVSVGLFSAWAKDVIAAASALDDLADATGSSVEELSKLSNIARVSGASFDQIDRAVKKLAVGLGGVDDETKNATKALQFLGVESRDPAKALTEIALKLNQYADGAGKAAIATAIWGKGGADLLPVLKDIAENADIVGTVTAKQAADAEALEKSWRRLSVEGTTFKNLLLSDIVPALNAPISAFNTARKAGLGWFDAFHAASFDDVAPLLEKARKNVAGLQEELERSKKLNAGSSFWQMFTGRPVEDVERDLQRATAAMNAYKKMLTAQYAGGVDNEGDMQVSQRSGKMPLIFKVPSGEDGKAARRAVADYADEMLRLNAAIDGTVQRYPQLVAAQAKVLADIRSGKVVLADEAVRYLKLAEAADEYAESAKKAADVNKQYAETEKQFGLDREKQRQTLLDMVRNMEAEVATLGLSNDERERSIALLTLENSQMDKSNGEYKELVRRINAAADAKRDFAQNQEAAKAAKEFADEWKRAADSISQSLTDALLRGFESGKSFAANFRDTLKNMFQTLVLRPVIQGVLAPVAGGMASLFSGAAGASTLGGGGLGSLFSGAGGIFGAGGIGNSFAFSSLGQKLGLSRAGLDTGGGLGLTDFGSFMGSALPIAGVALALAGMAGVFGKKGGPKTGGSASDIAGLGRFFTPNQSDADMRTLVIAVTSDFKAALANLGGSGVGRFGFGFDTDPQGTAPNRISGAAYVNGAAAYLRRDIDLGRDGDIQAALALESKRALLAALKASELPAQIAAVFNAAVPESMTSEQIDNLLAFGTAMKAVIDAISGNVAEDAQKAWADAQKTSVERVHALGAEVVRLASATDGTVETMTALATATRAYRQAAVDLLVAIESVRKAMTDMFAGTREQIETAGLANEQAYAYFTGKATDIMASIPTLGSPEQIEAAGKEFNRFLLAAFGTLDATQQGGVRDIFLGIVGQFEAAVNDQLTAIGAGVSSSTSGPFGAASTALDDAGSKFSAAADGQMSAAATQSSAADRMMAAAELVWQAANTPITVQLAGGYSNVNG